jgi:hypothetical protein
MAATLLGLSGIGAQAATEEEVSALLAEALLAPEWQTVVSGAFGGGYKDNVFLAHDNPQAAAFASFGAELLTLRFDPLGTSFNLFATADGRHFFGNGVSHQEYTTFTQAQVERDFNERWQGTIAAQYYYQDQVLDVSVTETNRQAVPVLGNTLNLRPGMRLNLTKAWWLAMEAQGTRQYFQQPLDDYWETGAKLTAGRSFGAGSKITLSYEPSWRGYDTDPALTATGDAITNSHREALRHDLRLLWHHHWNEQKTWRTVLGVGGRVNQENGGGYFDYVRWGASAKIEYRAHGWEIFAEGRYAHYDYQTQTISTTSDEKRRRGDWTAVVSVERELAEKLKWVTAYEFDTTTSNDPLEEYTVNTVSTGLRWDF